MRAVSRARFAALLSALPTAFESSSDLLRAFRVLMVLAPTIAVRRRNYHTLSRHQPMADTAIENSPIRAQIVSAHLPLARYGHLGARARQSCAGRVAASAPSRKRSPHDSPLLSNGATVAQ